MMSFGSRHALSRPVTFTTSLRQTTVRQLLDNLRGVAVVYDVPKDEGDYHGLLAYYLLAHMCGHELSLGVVAFSVSVSCNLAVAFFRAAASAAMDARSAAAALAAVADPSPDWHWCDCCGKWVSSWVWAEPCLICRALRSRSVLEVWDFQTVLAAICCDRRRLR